MKKLLFIFLVCLISCSCTPLVYDTTPGYNVVYYDCYYKPIYVNHQHHKPKKHIHKHNYNHNNHKHNNHKPNKRGHRK